MSGMEIVPYTGNKRAYNSGEVFVKRPRAAGAMIPYAPRQRPLGRMLVGRRTGSSNSGPYRQLNGQNQHSNSVYPVPETKFLDLSANGTAPATPPAAFQIVNTGFVTTLNNIPLGTGASARIGQKITMLSCAYRYEIALPTTGAVPTSGRVMLVWDRQPNNLSSVTAADILAQATYLSFMNITNVSRFVILRNQQFSLNPASDAEIFFEGYCKINMETTFGSTFPTTGSLLLFYIGDQAVGGTAPGIAGIWRVRYKDC